MINLKLALKNTEFASVSEKLQWEFDRRGITGLDNLQNAPIKCKVTYGADIYKVIKLVENYHTKSKKKVSNKQKEEVK